MTETVLQPDSTGSYRPMNRSRKTLISQKTKKSQQNHTKTRVSRFCYADRAKIMKSLAVLLCRQGEGFLNYTGVSLFNNLDSARVTKTRSVYSEQAREPSDNSLCEG